MVLTVLIPEENEKDLAEIPRNVTDKLEIHPVTWIDEVLEFALTELPRPREGESELDLSAKSATDPVTEGGADQIRPH